MLNVLHLDHTRTPGGAELALARLCDHALAHGLWAPLIGLPSEAGPLDAFAAESLSGCLLPLGPPQQSGVIAGGPAEKIRAARQLAAFAQHCREAARGRRIDVIHANTTRSALVGARLHGLIPAPLVIHLRDYWTRESLSSPILALLRYYAAPRAALAISNSNGTASTAVRNGGLDREQIVVIASPTGVPRAPRPMVREEVQEPLHQGGASIEILMVARLQEWKGQRLLIEAVSQVQRALPHQRIRLRLIGGPMFGANGYDAELRRLARDRLPDSEVIFTGQLPPPEVVPMIDRADICVQCSTRPEPLGQNVLQYMLRGKPIVAANSGGPSETVVDGQTGLLFTMGSAGGLAQALQRLITDPQVRTRLARNALAASERFSDEAVAEQHRDAFRQAFEQFNPPTGPT